jgi:FtsP/CotA-like multicopper oxidase with cupredoxin domain
MFERWANVIVGVSGGLLLTGLAMRAEATPATCARPAAGAAVAPPPGLYSQNGSLAVDLDYISSLDAQGRTLYCFVTRGGQESPTLYVNPGDTLDINLRNLLPLPEQGAPAMEMDTKVCGNPTMTAASVNMHFHGTNTTPSCHSDEVIHTLVNPGELFHYHIQFPASEPPGLYWYHPHVHGQAEAAVLGGATGALVVQGIEKLQPAVAGLPERVLVMRDQIVPGLPTPGGKIPSWDLSLNYVPISYPKQTPAVIRVEPGRREFWRVVNAGADTVSDIVLKYDGVPQPMEVVALDGVPTGSQDGTGTGKAVWLKHIELAPASRAEFIITTPTVDVKEAAFVSNRVDVGPAGDNVPTRTLALVKVRKSGEDHGEAMTSIPAASASTAPAQLFDGLDSAKVDNERRLYFSEVTLDAPKSRLKRRDDGAVQFYITEFGHRPKLFSASNPPAIETTQGSVEQWTIENRTQEVHAFHIHQIHFKLMERDGAVLPPSQQQYLDTVAIPFWKGKGPYPSVTVLMDFRGKITGDFVYHCHILEHEDGGMMATIRIKPRV